MFDLLLWILPHFVTHYAGQTNQGNTNDGDGVDVRNQASGSKDAASLIQRTDSLSRGRELQKTKESSSANPKPKNEYKGPRWIRNLLGSRPQQQSQSGSQSSTSYDPSQSDEMPLPVYLEKSEIEFYRLGQNTDQYRKFTKEEAKYFKSEYSRKKKLGQGKFGAVHLATRKSDGMKVAYKSILYTKVDEYTLESFPPPRCHSPSPLVLSEEQSVAQCMSPRPPNSLLPYEFATQRYLSRPGYENPYVPRALDYYILEDRYIVVMDYIGGKWVNLSRYMKKKGRLDIEDARDIVREVINGMINLKQHGVLQDDLHGMSQ
ncbi:hypothetical protein BASA61_006642 [Batrachochytrium salamandrivorans]|nr:hypothetical protein BASA61_006642 [Batrachochytrium salamandrivorans]